MERRIDIETASLEANDPVRAHSPQEANQEIDDRMAAVVRHWSTVLNGMQVDLDVFKRETDTVLKAAADKAKATSAKAQ